LQYWGGTSRNAAPTEGAAFFVRENHMALEHLFHSYEFLVDKADAAFTETARGHQEYVRCKRSCFDCCHAVFGLFLIEAAYIKIQFDKLDKELIRDTLMRCNETERALKRLETKLRNYEGDSETQARIMAQEKVRCPLLDEQGDCVLYPHRPITCRVYGIPTKVQGSARVCWKSGFRAGESYPVFDLDAVHRNLYDLSVAFLKGMGGEAPTRASFLFSLPRVLSTPMETLIRDLPG